MKYPVYIISKGRWESRMTARALDKINVPYKMVVEPSEYGHYAELVDATRLIKAPEDFSKRKSGGIPVRNFVWDLSLKNGDERHWILDDNIQSFYEYNDNKKIKCTDATPFLMCEKITGAYKNIALSGLQYEHMVRRRERTAPLVFNTRVYSCILINNSIPFRWRGKYNEDTDLSLRALKAGWCTVLLNTFLCNKVATMVMKGGNTDTVYATGDNRRAFAESLREQHPDVVDVVWKFNRWHHKVNYKPFKGNKLIPESEIKRVEKTEILQ